MDILSTARLILKRWPLRAELTIAGYTLKHLNNCDGLSLVVDELMQIELERGCTPPTQKELWKARCPGVKYLGVADGKIDEIEQEEYDKLF